MAIHRAPGAKDDAGSSNAAAELATRGIDAVIVDEQSANEWTRESTPQIALLDVAALSDADLRRCVDVCARYDVPLIALVPPDLVATLDASLELSDFVLLPPDPDELFVRARRVLKRAGTVEGEDLIRTGDLVINPATYEVSVKGRRVNLRFKEYELLRLLATNPGRVYTREVLLSSIWGYDYFGGTRTVDVHVRRLRSKIEDADHSFIETIWNVGYRFRDASAS